MATRMQRLAQPKSNHLRYSDRRSVYWLDELPPDRTGSTTKIELTPRWSDFCKSKRIYTQNTVSPIWKVSEWALRAVPSKRICNLAKPRVHAAGWQPDHPLLVPTSRASLTAVASSRVCQLAKAKKGPVLEGSKPTPISHLASKASAHIELLASPKHEHPKFEGERSVYWPVSRAARNHIASPRLRDLSRPKDRKALFEGYDPYIVSRAACSARPSPRIKELCLPLPRKCSSK